MRFMRIDEHPYILALNLILTTYRLNLSYLIIKSKLKFKIYLFIK